MDIDRSDERPHPAGDDPGWAEWWRFDFTAPDGALGGYVQVSLLPTTGVAWYWAALVGPRRPLVTVVDNEAPLPRSPRSLELRAEGLWADHICETPLEHWSVANEAFAVALDDPLEAYGRMLGDRVPLGIDLEWETDGAVEPAGDGGYEIPCVVHGEILVGEEQIDFAGHGWRSHGWGEARWGRPWSHAEGRFDDGRTFASSPTEVVPGREGLPREAAAAVDGLAVTVIPLAYAPVLVPVAGGAGAGASRLVRALCRFRAADGRRGHGWATWNQPFP